jgi:hypothetical protein
MRSETLAYIRVLTHELADLADNNDLGVLAFIYRMAEIEADQLEGAGVLLDEAA